MGVGPDDQQVGIGRALDEGLEDRPVREFRLDFGARRRCLDPLRGRAQETLVGRGIGCQHVECREELDMKWCPLGPLDDPVDGRLAGCLAVDPDEDSFHDRAFLSSDTRLVKVRQERQGHWSHIGGDQGPMGTPFRSGPLRG
jgi:hypothetical protein